jgi:hypothetical protein
MSLESVEVVRAVYGEWREGRSAVHWIHPDVERGKPHLALEPGGRDLALVHDVADFTAEPERYVPVGDEVVVIARTRRLGVGGERTSRRHGYVWTVRDDRVIGFRWFDDPREALEAVGLSE